MRNIIFILAMFFSIPDQAQGVRNFRDTMNFYGPVNIHVGTCHNGYNLTSDSFCHGIWTAPLDTAQFWKLHGNAGTNSAVNFVGTTDYQTLLLKSNKVTYLSVGKNRSFRGVETFDSIGNRLFYAVSEIADSSNIQCALGDLDGAFNSTGIIVNDKYKVISASDSVFKNAGKVQIVDGTQVAGYAFTCASDGLGSWTPICPTHTPSGSADTYGSVGMIVQDANYIYTKSGSGWGRSIRSTW
jgi:hypothetical protein